MDEQRKKQVWTKRIVLTFGHWTYHQQMYTNGAMPVPGDCDAARVATERSDILLDPVKGRDLVHQAKVASWSVVERRKEA